MFNWIRRRKPASRVRSNYRLFVESLEVREVLSTATAPVVAPIADVTLVNGGPLYVPVIASDGNNALIGYSATSSDPNVTVVARQGFGYLDIKVKGFGDMVFQLFSDISPKSVATISTLVQQGFYTNLTFHRIVPNFVIQGGDPLGNGSGGPGFGFPTESGPLSKFNGTGQLSLANQVQSGNLNSNGSQFFVTIGPQTSLNGDFTLLGQLVRGFDVENAIANVALSNTTNGTPVTPPVIQSATIIQDTTDTVLLIQAPSGYNADPVITVTGANGSGASTQSFHVQIGNGGVGLQQIQFVNRAFSTILNRTAEPSALNYFTGLLASNKATTSQIALQIQTSVEARMDTVKNVYQTLLARAPEQQALTAGAFYLMQGGSVANLEAAVTASQEYFEAKGGSNTAWISAMFKDATGATSVPLSYTTPVSAMLDQGLSRAALASSIFNSVAGGILTTQNLFHQFLERTPTASAVLPFAQLLAGGVSEDLIVSTIVGSNEFFNFAKNQNAGA